MLRSPNILRPDDAVRPATCALPQALSHARGSYRDTFFPNRQHEQGRLLWPMLCFLTGHDHRLNEDACFKAHFPGAMANGFAQSERNMLDEYKHVQVLIGLRISPGS